MSDVPPAPPEPQDLLASAEVRGLIERMVRRKVPAADVEDVVQTVLLDALASRSAPDGREPLRKWLAGITRHKIADFHRKGRRLQLGELSERLEAEGDPTSAREWAEWADKQTEGDPEKQQTLDWMAREGAGEKLAHIAEDDDVPAPQMRQRVSRLRRLMRQRWAAELAAVAAVAIAVIVAWRLLRAPAPTATPVPKPVPEVVPDKRLEEARRLRADAFRQCQKKEWDRCLRRLDEAGRLDPAGEKAPAVQRAREEARGMLEKIRERQRRQQKKDDGDTSSSSKSKAPVDTTPPAPTTPSTVKGPPPKAKARSKPNVTSELGGQDKFPPKGKK